MSIDPILVELPNQPAIILDKLEIENELGKAACYGR